jgi:hypothetical protein
MFTTTYLDELMMAQLRDPSALCEALKLRPSKAQIEVMEEFKGLPPVIERVRDSEREMIRVACLLALWRVLCIPGSRGTLVCAERDEASHAMDFLTALTTRVDPALAAVTHQTRWNALSFGSDPGWELRLIPNLPHVAAEMAPSTLVAVVIGAASSDPAFHDTAETLEKGLLHPHKTLIRLW